MWRGRLRRHGHGHDLQLRLDNRQYMEAPAADALVRSRPAGETIEIRNLV
jgi:hypothetical protein